ncbi:MAG: hypothetical protein GY861_02630, partial [bacterium]|nr:hypothetical protein [bacterium]
MLETNRENDMSDGFNTYEKLLKDTKGHKKTIPTTNPTESTESNNMEKGQEKLAEDALNYIVKCMVMAGCSQVAIHRTLLHYNYLKRTVPEKEILVRMNAFLSEKKKGGLSLTDEIADYIQTTEGAFSLKDVGEMIGAGSDKVIKNKISAIMCRFIKDGTCERVGKKNGVFRKIDTDLEVLDFVNVDEKEVDIWLPFGLHNMVTILPGNIILISGERNAGKTALLLNLIRYNMQKFDVHYFNSEMGALEMKMRLKNFDDICLSDWKFSAYNRTHDFADVIIPGEGNLNLVDFLEASDEFYRIGG